MEVCMQAFGYTYPLKGTQSEKEMGIYGQILLARYGNQQDCSNRHM
jgi:hypothetical protein